MSKKPLNMDPTSLTAKDLYLKGREIEQADHQEAEKGKLGNLRGGSTGCLTSHGEVYGTCHRKALARLKGHQAQIEEISFAWFDAGYANEDAWEQKLQKSVAALGPGYELKSEEECPVTWEINGRKVTGRPDLMVFKDGKPEMGLELKVVCAVKSAVSIYCEDKPKVDNILQAAHYSMIHGCPFTLVYSWRSRARVPGWAERYKDKLNMYYEKTFTNSKTGRSFTKREYAIDPFIKEFLIGFDDDVIYYVTEDGTRVDTPFTAQGIRDYYALVDSLEKEKKLYTRLTQRDMKGDLLPYDPCQWCPFIDACDQFENDYDAWLDKVQLICEEGPDE